MKITREHKIILEDAQNDTVVAQDLVDKIDKTGAIAQQDQVDLANATKKELFVDIAQGAAEENSNTGINLDGLEAEVKKIYTTAELIKNPVGTGRPGAIEKILQTSLDAALADREDGFDNDYQNVIIYGLAGFGKTAIVKKFCDTHHLNMFECDAKNLDAATVSGIPYPVKDELTGETTQSPIASRYWDTLNAPNTVLFLDELNRANGRIRGTLLDLINTHTLPANITDPKTGKHYNRKRYRNILFTVIAINPADDVFEDNFQLDPAMISRNPAIIEQKGDKKELLNHITAVYEALLANPNLSASSKARRQGQLDLAKTILTDPAFQFDDADTVRRTYLNQGKKMENYLNYRTFFSILKRSDGTKRNFLDVVEHQSGLIQNDRLMIKNILATYVDKVTIGNNLFGQNTVKTSRQLKAESDAEAALRDFEKNI